MVPQEKTTTRTRENFCANFVPLAYKIRPYCGISPNIFYLLSY